jgi:hypothetical protein
VENSFELQNAINYRNEKLLQKIYEEAGNELNEYCAVEDISALIYAGTPHNHFFHKVWQG